MNVLARRVLESVAHDLRTGRIIGAEALARFKAEPYRTPDPWFEEAGAALGTPLELSAIDWLGFPEPSINLV